MYTRIYNIWSNFRASFWFVPTVLLLLTMFVAFGMISFDWHFRREFLVAFPALELSPPAARSILSSIVGAMVSTTGVVFSITVVALSLASSQFGSRLIRTYRKRRTSHFTLGIFVSTSLFCILVLASIREVDGSSFVPVASVILGILLTVVCLGTLVYYIHDMSEAIQAPSVIQHSATDLDDAINRLFPAEFGDQVFGEASQTQLEESALKSVECELAEPSFSVCCGVVGYLQAVENETLMAVTEQHDLIVRLHVRPGDFLFDELLLAEVMFPKSTPDEDVAELEPKLRAQIQQCLIVGSNRTHVQDVRHAFDELVDIAVRALSPGINDPFTAVNCVDRIHAALKILQRRQIPSAYRLDGGGRLRVIAQPVAFDECTSGSLGVISTYAEGNPMVESRIAAALGSLETSEKA